MHDEFSGGHPALNYNDWYYYLLLRTVMIPPIWLFLFFFYSSSSSLIACAWVSTDQLRSAEIYTSKRAAGSYDALSSSYTLCVNFGAIIITLA
jgi:hypothetical protein